MEIVACNPGHDGAIAHLCDGHLVSSVEAEKDSNWRYTPFGTRDLFDALGRLERVPDVLATGGWWPREADPTGPPSYAGYRGFDDGQVVVDRRPLLGTTIDMFSSSHERSHILCAYGMSPFPQGEPCYALVWEGAIGAFYEIGPDASVSHIGDVMNQPGNRYASVFGLADPSFPKDALFPRYSDAGKLMALASFARRSEPTTEEEVLMDYLFGAEQIRFDEYERAQHLPYLDVGHDDPEFRNFAGLFSDRLFGVFQQFAEEHLRAGRPLVIAGGCGLNCDWNTKWRTAGLFSEVFVPPVANDSGSAIGTAIDAQLYFTGDAKISWDVYAGLPFETDSPVRVGLYDILEVSYRDVAGMLSFGLVLGWVSGRYEIGPRALGNRSILAAPFDAATRSRLNEIKQREHYRPIAPVCLDADAAQWFGCHEQSPHMLFTYSVSTAALGAVTHVNGTARLQTVNPTTNIHLYQLLVAFKEQTGFGVLCNTSLNFNGKGAINRFSDLDTFAIDHGLDGFVVDDRAFLVRTSELARSYQESTAR